mmetsp:Transcript_16408/g.30641  ORF Transcript_16408/g.30641 Transcript_16408/m.30641 type:complete len:283 (+) Transcript_16408:319-1167(+)
MTGLFALFCLVKLLGNGLPLYFKDSYNSFDLILVTMAILADVTARMGNGHYILVVTFFTLLRYLMMLRKMQQFRISIYAVIASVGVLGNFALTLLNFIYPTAIMLTVFIGQNSRLANKETDEGTKNMELWGSLPKSMLSLFQIATLDWGDIVRASVMDEPILAVAFISFILATGFAVSNVFITIIGEQYNDINERVEAEREESEGVEEHNRTRKKKDQLLENVRRGHTSHEEVDFTSIRKMNFTNADIACMIVSLQQQLHKQDVVHPLDRAFSVPAVNTASH